MKMRPDAQALCDNIKTAAENHGEREGNEPQIEDLNHAVEVLCRWLSPEAVAAVHASLARTLHFKKYLKPENPDADEMG